ncbi:MAG: ABC transporter ATP-binding protein/permease [Sterolibacteriaceae bacterium MAG5]|nr:ABC transporter ATP-binding protein/permease [Candidatus Nitricoxidireducens bremensis]
MTPSMASTNPIATVWQLWRLLTPSQQRGARHQLLLMVVGMVLETFSVGLIVPLIVMLSGASSDIAMQPAYGALLAFFDNPTPERLVMAALLAFLLMYAGKTLFLAFLAWRQARFVYGVQAYLSQHLFQIYLTQPYSFHLQRNSAQLIYNVTTVAAATSDAMYFGLQLITELFVITGLVGLLLYMEPLGAVVIGTVLAGAAWFFLRITRRRVTNWGATLQFNQEKRLQHLQQGLGCVKEVILLGRERLFMDRFREHTVLSLHAAERQLVLQQLPRLWLEMLAVAGLVGLVTILIARGESLDIILSTVGLFAVAAFRLMPSTTRVVNCIQTLRFGLPAIDKLDAELALTSAKIDRGDGSLPFGHAIELEGVAYAYADAQTPVLNGIDLVINHGESIGLVGPSGAGKSTLLDIILGLLPVSAGVVRVDGVDITSNLRGWQCQIGYVPQSIYLIDDTLWRNVAFGVPDEQIDRDAVSRAINAAQLTEFVSTLPAGMDTVVGERGVRLSGGQRQRIGIARALYHDPKVLVLDEATSALDFETEAYVMETVQALMGSKTIIIVTHRVSTIENCDRVFLVDSGMLRPAVGYRAQV